MRDVGINIPNEPCTSFKQCQYLQNLHKGVLRDNELYAQKLKERSKQPRNTVRDQQQCTLSLLVCYYISTFQWTMMSVELIKVYCIYLKDDQIFSIQEQPSTRQDNAVRAVSNAFPYVGSLGRHKGTLLQRYYKDAGFILMQNMSGRYAQNSAVALGPNQVWLIRF